MTRPLTALERAILDALAVGPRRPLELADACGEHPGSVAHAASRLALRELVVRIEGPRKSRPYAITHAGHAARRVDDAAPGHMRPGGGPRRETCARYEACLDHAAHAAELSTVGGCPWPCRWYAPAPPMHAVGRTGEAVGGDASIYADPSGRARRRGRAA